MSNASHPHDLTALITLLGDDDVKVASLAMEQFLRLGLADEMVAELQEAQDPTLRQRAHQLGNVLTRRRARGDFLEAVAHERLSVWDGVMAINALYDPQYNRRLVVDYVQGLVNKLVAKRLSATRVAALMRDEELAVPAEDTLDVELYLADRIVETRYGAPALLCALAQEVGNEAGWNASIVLYEGRFCLIDARFMLLDPSEGWHLSKLDTDTKIHPCSRKDVWLGILAQLFLVCLVDGHLRDLHHFGDLLSSLNRMGVEEALPYPLGGRGPE